MGGIERKLSVPHITVAAARHCGTHLIFPLVKAITGKRIIVADKQPQLARLSENQVVVFHRDPRDWIVSWHRWNLRKIGEPNNAPPNFGHDKHIAAMILRRTRKNRRNPKPFWRLHPLEAQYLYFEFWLKEADVVSKFATLANAKTGLAEAVRIARELGGDRDKAKDAFRFLFKNSPTHVGGFSNWKQWFGPQSKEAFEKTGGKKLLKLLGYK